MLIAPSFTYSTRFDLLQQYMQEYHNLHHSIRSDLSLDAYVQFSIVHDVGLEITNAVEDVKSETDDVEQAVKAVETAIENLDLG